MALARYRSLRGAERAALRAGSDQELQLSHYGFTEADLKREVTLPAALTKYGFLSGVRGAGAGVAGRHRTRARIAQASL